MAAGLVLLLGLAGGGAALRLAGREYNQSFIEGTVLGHIVSVWRGLVYLRYSDDRAWSLRGGASSSKLLPGLPEASVQDVVLVPPDAMWVATGKGLYKYNIVNNRTLQAVPDKITSMAVGSTGTLYVTDASFAVFIVRGKTLVRIPKVRAHRLAVSRDAQIFHTTDWDSPLYRRWLHADGATVTLKGLPAGYINVLEVDRRDEALYAGHEKGLFSAQQGGDTLRQVAGLGGEVLGLGFSARGDFFIGIHSHIINLTLTAPDVQANKTRKKTSKT